MSAWMWVLIAMATIGFWIVVGVAVRELFPPGPAQGRSATDEPLRLLEERLARGEIDAEQFVAAKHLLTHGR